MANLQRRLTALQGRLPSPEEQPPRRTEAGRKLLEWLDGYSQRKRGGTLSAEDEAQAEEIREALQRRRRELDRGEGRS